MFVRRLCVSLALATLLSSGCCWCHRWHRHCYQPAPAPVPVPIVVPAR
jgi:hypothetical protein